MPVGSSTPHLTNSLFEPYLRKSKEILLHQLVLIILFDIYMWHVGAVRFAVTSGPESGKAGKRVEQPRRMAYRQMI